MNLQQIREELALAHFDSVSVNLVDYNAVLVLSGYYPDYFDQEIVRLTLGSRIYQNLCTISKSISPTGLYLIGASEQLGPLYLLTKELFNDGTRIADINLVDCGPKSTANTKTQFTTLLRDTWQEIVNSWQKIVIVSSWYHIPRVARTATKYLPKHIMFTMRGSDWSHPDFSANRLIDTELKKINHYIQAGDIAKNRRDLSHRL